MRTCLLLAVAIGLLGCGKPPSHLTEAAPPNLTDPWKLGSNEKYGISVGIAPGWREGSGPSPSMSSLSGNNPLEPRDALAPKTDEQKAEEEEAAKKAARDEQAELEKRGILLMATDGSRTLAGEEPTQYSLKHVTLPGEMDLENGVKVARQDLSFAHDPEYVDLPIGKAAKFTIDFKNRGGDQIHQIVFVFVDGKELYKLDFTCTGDDKIKAIADPVAQSLRIKPGLTFESAG